MIISLLQPSSEVTAVFDDILLLGQGYCYYYGPTSGVEAYFSNLGYQCPKTQDFNDFLLEVGTPTGKSLQVRTIMLSCACMSEYLLGTCRFIVSLRNHAHKLHKVGFEEALGA